MLASILAATMLLQSSTTQFDLTCSGTSTTLINGRTHRSTFDSRYHFDLEKSVWCIGACQSVRDIEEVTPTTIVFHVVTDAGTNVFRISRMSGALMSVWQPLPGSVHMPTSSRGSCEVAPYTVIPMSTRF